MLIETLQQAKDKLQSLTESLWIFSAFTVLAETNTLETLKKETSFSTLEKISKVPAIILEQTINLLIETGFLVSENKMIKLAPGILELIEKMGVEKIVAQSRIVCGQTNEFIKTSRDNSIRVGWHYTDELILQAQGTYSEYIATDCVPQDNRLENLLKQSEALFLDVGAGVGRISLRMCDLYQNLQVVALEPADKPFSLAKKNFAESIHQSRIELRKIHVEDLQDQNTFDVVWFPHVFFSDKTLIQGLACVWQALKPGGMFLTCAISSDKSDQSFYIRKLNNSLYGGLRKIQEVIDALENAGFGDVKVFSEISGYRTVTATKQI